MKKYTVTFTEKYTYTKHITIEDDEDINEVIHDPLDFPMVRYMTEEQFNANNVDVLNEYEVIPNDDTPTDVDRRMEKNWGINV